MAVHNRVINHMFGVTHGMSIGILTFDWGQIVYITSPLSIPWWAAARLTLASPSSVSTGSFLYVRPSLFLFCFVCSPTPAWLSHYFMAVHEHLVLVLPSFDVLALLR